ncbi:MAG TPA: hypothetical protein VGW39_12195 [Chthoniobacterales bacterium]|nr:hypothetical protein [Chthoniobacterales bacterium]
MNATEKFLEKFNNAIIDIRMLAADTFSLLARQLTVGGITKAVDSAASTHATLGGNLATAAGGIAKAVDSAASTHATLGGNLAATAAALTETGFVEREYINHFRTLVLTMLGELPRRGHLTSDFDEMFHINYEKPVTREQFREMGELISKVKEDWTSDEFLKEPPEMIQRMRMNLLQIAEMLDIREKIPTTFDEHDLEVAPHIALLNDFTDQLFSKMGGRIPTYPREGIENNPNLLESAKRIVRNHRDDHSPLALKMLRTAFLENTAQARIQGLRIIADNYGLGQHPYLTTHDIVEGYHGRDSLEELRTFVLTGSTPIEKLEAYLGEIMEEVRAFYASMSQSVQVS